MGVTDYAAMQAQGLRNRLRDLHDRSKRAVEEATKKTRKKTSKAKSSVTDYAAMQAQGLQNRLSDLHDRSKGFIDKYLWDTSADEAGLEKWVRDTFDIADEKEVGFITELWHKFIGEWDESVDDVEELLKVPAEVIYPAVTELFEGAGDLLSKLGFNLGVGFDAATIALAGLPGLLISFKDELADWFKFDINEFKEAMAKVTPVIETPKEGD